MLTPRSAVVVLATGVLVSGLATAPVDASPARSVGSTTTSSPRSVPGLDSAQDRAPSKAAPRARGRQIQVNRWRTSGLRSGTFVHTRYRGGVQVGRHPDQITYRDPYGSSGPLAYDRGTWRSRWVRPGFGLTELIASWNAATPVGTFIEVSARGRARGGRMSSWDSLGRWASHDTRFHRMSLGEQGDDLSYVAVDTLVTDSGVSFRAWQLRLSLMRRSGSGKTPTVTMAGAMASRLPDGTRTSAPRPGRGHSLQVPRYSQEIHVGEYPQYNGGGEAWCSPTSTSMVVAYWNRGPTRKQYSWVNPAYRDPWVDYAARYTYAWNYDGTGDWPFNTAYAGRFGLDSFVTRLRSLREAELFIDAGIPLVASISFGPGELDGAPINSTAGHLVVIRGITDAGKVVVNDPAAPGNRSVRRVYKRGQFERAWVGATGGVVYVIHPLAKKLPRPRHHSNW